MHPSTHDVVAALRWALEHDLDALLDHRRHRFASVPARRAADARLVTRWRLAVGQVRADVAA
ncbi:hypothetical protein [Isoptericola variabilis]|uniref:hypothetical protein n=1 Tax=Isoptericola variabilis TaxID=139208 RepID=UPI0002DD2FE9|nr:hypothetical protein [Isoptericola variabilis]